MADDADKTEEPTGKRLGDERAKGNIPRSAELVTAAMLWGSAVIFTGVAPAMGHYLVQVMTTGLYNAAAVQHEPRDLLYGTIDLGWRTLAQLSLLLGAFAMLAIVSSAMQARGHLAPKAIEWSFHKLNPLTNIKRLLGMQGLVDLLKSVVKLVIIGSVV